MCIFTFTLNSSPCYEKVGLEITSSNQQVNLTLRIKERMMLSSESKAHIVSNNHSFPDASALQ